MRAILLVKTSSLGDVVHNLPVATDIRARFPEARIDWVVEERFAGIPRLHPAVSQVLPVAVRRWRRALLSRATWREMNMFRHRMGDEPYDLVLDTQGLIKSALVARLASGPRAGYAAEAAREGLAARFYDRSFAIPRNLHAVERNRWLAAAALGYDPGGPLDYGISAPPLSADWLPAGPYAVLFTATSRDDKLWPEKDWIQLIGDLAAKGLASVLPSGSAEERARAERIAAAGRDAVVAPPLGIPELASLIGGSRLVVGVDTGLTHLAAALSRPTIGLYCGSDPALTGVYAPGNAINLGELGRAPTGAEVLAAMNELGL